MEIKRAKKNGEEEKRGGERGKEFMALNKQVESLTVVIMEQGCVYMHKST